MKMNEMTSEFPHDSSYCDSERRQRFVSLRDPASATANPATLLVVDDDSVFRQLEARALSEQGYKVLQAASAEEALRLAAKTPRLDLLLTDFNIPGADGLELSQQIRHLHPTAPVLVVTGALPLAQQRAKDLDRFALLEKSSSFDELLEQVRKLLTEVLPLPFSAMKKSNIE